MKLLVTLVTRVISPRMSHAGTGPEHARICRVPRAVLPNGGRVVLNNVPLADGVGNTLEVLRPRLSGHWASRRRPPRHGSGDAGPRQKSCGEGATRAAAIDDDPGGGLVPRDNLDGLAVWPATPRTDGPSDAANALPTRGGSGHASSLGRKHEAIHLMFLASIL
jgi:hypothetical protein